MRRLLLKVSQRCGRTPIARRSFSAGKSDAPLQTPAKQASVRSRFDRFIERTPRFLRPTVTGLRQAPVSHIAAFIILHELTAVIPLFGLAGAFHYWRWLPPYFAEGAWINAGVERFGRYFRKKGWISERDELDVEEKTKQAKAGKFEKQTISKWFNRGEDTTRWVVEFATAYAVVKVLLPLRLVISVWGAPWFARLAVIPFGKATRSIFRRKKS
ncbi:hypothetical protein HRR83_009103 [Exophiala dermatitidis]|uniref:Uncharacterized protein n=2 Tax=Exophiala dermatitidis TaxID=5970 RepID=H6BX17_EXODN|nr:uncharacterized protein HMPREF1120_03445 [Exophiala dermatitidis NIH/UT8656]KAJ4503145.1 hypothetical protein HRR73_009156 [Exophiala dermatitidis]EHY55303.1 hypothetical protein HMPREF1120_03445 [Exophiala dermatitidis NIH/UT8656]KAJ4508277.1 hypothetical protein HRR74_007676 [Exophiala dermatitidis]KAJ4533280.1 hypothetical protein HRR77_008811 [Exophiala dermatitidis]KAJ4540191.1 hypothetical protein HRR76_003606 [Exophiala dermatitidis]